MNNKVAAASLLILLTLISIQHTTSFSTNLAVFPSQPDSYSLPYDLGVNETRTSDVLTPPIDDSTEPAVNKVSETVDASNINKASNEATNKSIVESENNSSIAETVDAILVLETPTIVGKWFVLAKAYVGEKPAVDTLTFKVPITTEAAELDVYTQKGGEGANASSGPFNPGEVVTLYVLFTYNGDPVQSRLVIIEVHDPDGNILLIDTIMTDEFGFATHSFRLPDLIQE